MNTSGGTDQRWELGLSLAAADLPPETLGELGSLAERSGYGSFWCAEVRGSDAFAELATVACATERLALGTAIVPVFTRAAPLLAMSALTLQRLSGGRFSLGIGASSPTVVSSWMGRAFERPLDHVRDAIRIIRAAVRGDRVDYDGTAIHVTGLRLTLPPAPTPILVGATGPSMLRLAGEEADGIVAPAFVEPWFFGQWLDSYWAGVDTTDRPRESTSVVATVLVAMGDTTAPRHRHAARRLLGGYLVAPGYNRLLRAQGHHEAATAIAEAGARGDALASAAAVPDELVDSVFVPPANLADRIDALRRAGATTVLLEPFSGESSTTARLEQARHFVATSAEAHSGRTR